MIEKRGILGSICTNNDAATSPQLGIRFLRADAAYGNSSQVSPLAQLGGAGLQLQFQPQATPHVQPQMTLQGLQAFAAAMAAMNPHGGAAAVTPTTPITPLTPLSPLSLSHSLNLQVKKLKLNDYGRG